ncbi:hypothetical protein B5M09_014015, partial [Aphanomyces astaci]
MLGLIRFLGVALDATRVAAILAKSHIVEFEGNNVEGRPPGLFIDGNVATFCLVVLHGHVLVSSSTSGNGIFVCNHSRYGLGYCCIRFGIGNAMMNARSSYVKPFLTPSNIQERL